MDQGIGAGGSIEIRYTGGSLEQMREWLGHDLVYANQGEGGYYLIGLNRPAPGLFRGIDWGGDQVFGQTMHEIPESGTRLFPGIENEKGD